MTFLSTRLARGGAGVAGLTLALLVAIGIGVHNLGEGLAIGTSFAVGELQLGSFLIVGFMIHNVTEGLGIAAPATEARRITRLQLVGLALVAGAPAIAGAWIGGYASNDVLAVLFFGAAAGAALQVVVEVGRYVARRAPGGLRSGWATGGFLAGIAVDVPHRPPPRIRECCVGEWRGALVDRLCPRPLGARWHVPEHGELRAPAAPRLGRAAGGARRVAHRQDELGALAARDGGGARLVRAAARRRRLRRRGRRERVGADRPRAAVGAGRSRRSCSPRSSSPRRCSRSSSRSAAASRCEPCRRGAPRCDRREHGRRRLQRRPDGERRGGRARGDRGRCPRTTAR